MTQKEECGNCRFWRLRSDDAKNMGGGYCVRFPPFVSQAFVVTNGLVVASSGHLNDAWPMVHQQSWCGEYQSMPDLKAKELISVAKARIEAMTPDERKAMLDEQAESYARSLLPCEHGMVDWEDCLQCRDKARNGA